jgi:choline monooxygenase
MTWTFSIDPDIAVASTPPSRLYTAADVFDSQRESVFARSWQFAAHTECVRLPNQVHPLTLLEGCLDEPLLLTRDAGDRVHCVSNVCTHRGNLVCENPGIERGLRCRYHGRRFGLDGRFLSMPEFEATRNFPSPADDLPRLPLEAWGPLLFTGIRPATAFGDWIEPLRRRVGWLEQPDLRFDASRSRDYLVACNWALYCENYLEGFHIPFVHGGLSEVIDYGSYRTELYAHASLQVGASRGGQAAFEPPPDSPDAGQAVAAYYFWLFPNLMLNFYPWGLSLNIVRPLSVDRTRVSFLTYVRRPELLDRGAGSGLDRVEREDEAIVEAVQRGVRSRLYDRGRYSATRETGTHHFHRLLAAAMGPSGER